jgi:hypothetical protein
VEVVQARTDIARFLDSGNRVIVTEERNLHRVEELTPVDIHFRARSGYRALVVVTPSATRAATGTP